MASGFAAENFKITRISAGSVIVIMQIMPDPLRTATAPIDIAKDLEKQAADPNSALRSGKLTRQTQGFQVLSLPSAVNTDFDKDLKGLNKDPLQTPTDELEKEVLEVQREVDCLCAHMDQVRLIVCVFTWIVCVFTWIVCVFTWIDCLCAHTVWIRHFRQLCTKR